MYKRIKIVDSEKWLIYYGDNKYGAPPKFWENFIEINKLNYSYYKHIDTVLILYDAYTELSSEPKDKARYLIFKTLEGYTEFMLRWS